MKPEYDSKKTDDPELVKELTLQVRKVIGPFAAPKKIVRVPPSLLLPLVQTGHPFGVDVAMSRPPPLIFLASFRSARLG